MSELTKEKIYRNELIKAGATGNNNLERIRSLQNGGGGGTPKEEIKEISNFNYDLSEMASATVGDNIYLFGGFIGGTHNDSTADIHVLNTKSNLVQKVAEMPTFDFRSLTSAVVGNFVYLFGGRKKSGASESANLYLYKFNTTNNVAEQFGGGEFANYMCAVAVGGKIYLLNPNVRTMNIEYFDVTKGTVTIESTGKNFQLERQGDIRGTKAVAVGGFIYYFYDGKISKYEADTNTLRELSITTPETLSGEAITVIGGDIYLFGGLSDSIYKFSTANETIEKLSLKFNYTYSTAQTLGNNIYLFGGVSLLDFSLSSKIFELNVQL